MKPIHFFLILLYTNALFGQRYLTPVFDEVAVSQNIEYGSAMNYLGEEELLLLDFYEPVGDDLTRRPLVIFAHGGGFVDVTQSKNLLHIEAYCDSLARRGYVVASIDYRLDQSICNRAVINAMHDMRAAIRYFKKEQSNFGIDTSVVVVTGESAGAITALTTAYINSEVEVLYPPNNPQSLDQTIQGNSGNPGFSSKPLAVMCLCAGTETSLGEVLFDTLAINNNLDPPLLQIHGTADFLIPISKALEVSLRAANLELPFLFYPLQGANHCPWFFPLENSWAYLDTLVELTVPFLHAATTLSTSIDNIPDIISEFSISPNPNSGVFRILNIDDYENEAIFTVYNVKGDLMYQRQLGDHDGKIEIDLKLSPGLYAIRLRSNRGSSSQLMIVD